MMQTHLVIGLPKAGKTTFLAALWYVVETSRVAGALELVELPPNRAHLNGIRDRWVQCSEQIHTTTSSEREIRLKLRKPQGQAVTELIVPDLSGESFELQWSHRQCSRKYNELASSATGVLLFVHAYHPTQSVTIADEIAIGNALRDDPEQTQSQPMPVPAPNLAIASSTPDGERPWDNSLASPQVKLVELLQFLTVRPFTRRRFRVGVVISAWDRIKALNLVPNAWLANSMPLLDQFLTANQEVFESQVYGVSATGGDLKKESDRLLSFSDPVDRIEIVGQGIKSNDITLPVQYLME